MPKSDVVSGDLRMTRHSNKNTYMCDPVISVAKSEAFLLSSSALEAILAHQSRDSATARAALKSV